MKISIIIPTYNRRDVLINKTICALEKQEFRKKDYEVLIVDDGSTDGTSEAISEIIPLRDIHIRLFKQCNSGPAVARNRAIREADGEILIIIGDDTYPPKKDFIATHYQHHIDRPEPNEAMLGLTVWDKTIETSFMAWLQATNKQFSYNLIRTGTYVDYRFLYTSNLSIKKRLITTSKEYFDERFKIAAYEDIEWGYRLEKNCVMRLFYNDNALLFHHHLYTQSDFLRRLIVSEEVQSKMMSINNDLYEKLRYRNPISKIAINSMKKIFLNKYFIRAIPSGITIEAYPRVLQEYIFQLLYLKYKTLPMTRAD
jgi:glycosyltransferase involved in cell wall biosynthesis